MFAHELRDMLTGRTEGCEHLGKNALNGDVYFEDEDGKRRPLNFLEVDEEGNIILSWRGN